LRRIFRNKARNAAEEWRIFQNKELHTSYLSPDIIKALTKWIRWEGHVIRMEEKRNG
jgi:hypothetical protein